MPDTFVHFELPADDPAKLKKFYGGVFGWTFNTMPMPGGGGEYNIAMTTEQGKPGINGGVYKRMNKDDKPRQYIGVASIDESLKKVQSNGGKVAGPKMAIPGIGWFAHITDPEGNSQALFQDDKNAK